MKIIRILNDTRLNAIKHTSSTTKYCRLMYFYFIGRAHLRDISAFIYLTFYSGESNLYSEEICFSGVMVWLLMSCWWQIPCGSVKQRLPEMQLDRTEQTSTLLNADVFIKKHKIKIHSAHSICEINLKWSTSGSSAHSTDLRSFCAV